MQKYTDEGHAKATLDLDGRSLIVGLGESGLSVARFLHRHNASMRVIDSRKAPPAMARLARDCGNVEVVTETLDPKWLDGIARLVLSPGLSVSLPIVKAAQARGIAVINDIEIFAHFANAPVVAVTGSNGKSTVTTLVANLLTATGFNAPAGGNLGTPALDLLRADADAYVVEISSFQMEAAESLRAMSAAVLNLSPDHLDRHSSVDEYAALKEKLLLGAEHAVINDDDDCVRNMARAHSNVRRFSVQHPLAVGTSILKQSDVDWVAMDGKALLPVSHLAMRGKHNVANALAALELIRPLVAIDDRIIKTLTSFAGLPHRCEFIAEISGVTYINDSKATNIGATAAALDGLDGPIVLIAGGRSKSAEFAALRDRISAKVRRMLVIGEAAGELHQAFDGLCPIEQCDSLASAVSRAQEMTLDGDTVLLSPACSSLDMFANYEARGEAFRNAVMELQP